MLRLRHRFAPSELDARFTQDEMRSEDLIICRATFAGGRFAELHGAPSVRRESWSSLRFVLEGRVGVGEGPSATILHPGDFAIGDRWKGVSARALDDVTSYLTIGWKTGSTVGESPRMSEIVRASEERNASAGALDLARAMRGSSPEEGDAAAGTLMRTLARMGAGISPDAIRAASPVAVPHHRFAAAVEATLFGLTTRPMVVDLCERLGVGERQAMRLASDYFARFHITVSGWREYVRTLRFEMAMFLASHRASTTEAMSRALGFSSPTSLCHAFHAAGLGSPLAVQRSLNASA